MICNICGTNEATIHLTEIINNQMVEIHMCETCAKEKGTDFKTHFHFGDLFAGMAEFEKAFTKGAKQTTLKCRECGMGYGEFGKTGRLGCAACYETFGEALLAVIKRVQRSTYHVGKKPSHVSRDVRTVHDLRMLKDRLRKSIQKEEFEEAAHLRDQIKHAEDKIKRPKKSK